MEGIGTFEVHLNEVSKTFMLYSIVFEIHKTKDFLLSECLIDWADINNHEALVLLLIDIWLGMML